MVQFNRIVHFASCAPSECFRCFLMSCSFSRSIFWTQRLPFGLRFTRSSLRMFVRVALTCCWSRRCVSEVWLGGLEFVLGGSSRVEYEVIERFIFGAEFIVGTLVEDAAGCMKRDCWAISGDIVMKFGLMLIPGRLGCPLYKEWLDIVRYKG